MSVAVVLKGYPRLSETFIAQEICSLERAGFTLELFSLRHPTDPATHPVHAQIKARANYLPEYLWHNPWRILKAWRSVRQLAGYKAAKAVWLKDLRRDLTLNRVRRFGQALVLAHEMPGTVSLIYAHFLHTPASVARYAAALRKLPWSFSAHAKDIWTIPQWEKREKLADCAWGVTCTEMGFSHLSALCHDGVSLTRVYHGLDETRFPDPGPRSMDPGEDSPQEIKILSVGRAVDKKGFDVLLEALAQLPATLRWHWQHVGGGDRLQILKTKAKRLQIDSRISWMGPLPQNVILELYQKNELFILPSRVTAGGDRDGLPNVLMEAASQRLCIIATNLPGISEFIESGKDGILLSPNDPQSLADAIVRLSGDVEERRRYANSAVQKLKSEFGHAKAMQPLLALMQPHAEQ
jgi:colanic acid/amylovoran biosynthesis glycosyltransferase